MPLPSPISAVVPARIRPGFRACRWLGEGRQDIGVARLLQHGQALEAHAEIIAPAPAPRGSPAWMAWSRTPGAEAQRQLQGAGVEIGAPAAPRGGMTADGEQDGDIKRHRGLELLAGQAGQRRHDLLRIGDDGEIGALHHVGMEIGIDRHHPLAARDALQMLGGAGDAEGEITARLHQAARGADLPAARQQPGIADDAAAALGRTQRGGDLVEGGPVGDAIAGADDEIRLGQRHGIGIGRGQAAIGEAALLDGDIDGRQSLRFPERAWRRDRPPPPPAG